MPERQRRRVREVFDDWAKKGRADAMEANHRVTAEQVLTAAPVAEGRPFLDLGCGNGWAARDVAARGAVAFGVDIAPAMLSAARERGAGKPGATAFVRASMDALPFRDGTFAGGFSMEALYYAPDVGAALAEARRVLTSGARFDAVVDRYEENAASHKWDEDLGVDMHLMSEAAWREAFAAAGFADAASTRARADPGKAAGWLTTHGSLHVSGRVP